MAMTIPKPLRPGDTVAVIGVSGCVRGEDPERLVHESVKKLTGLGFRVKVDPTCWARYGYLSGTDEERAAAMNRAFADDTVDGVWCVKGGNGCIRLMEMIDWDMIARHPKAFIGYSDITTLHSALIGRCGLCTFHGPMPKTDRFDGKSLDSLMHAISGHPDRELTNPDGSPLRCLRPGIGEGELVGGNLSLIAASIGTAYDLDVTGRLLFLEDVGEYTYSIDRMLQQLYLSGKLTRCAGVILGGFTNCEMEHEDASLTLEQVFEDVFKKVNVPVISGLQAGHLSEKLTLPLGRRYRMDAGAGSISLIDY